MDELPPYDEEDEAELAALLWAEETAGETKVAGLPACVLSSESCTYCSRAGGCC